MESAVRSTSASGRKPSRTSHQPPAMASTSAPAVTASSISSNECSVSLVAPMGSATTLRTLRVAPTSFTTVPLLTCTRKAGPPLLVEAALKYVTGAAPPVSEKPVIWLGNWGLYFSVPT
jgi:hypothetical protein